MSPSIRRALALLAPGLFVVALLAGCSPGSNVVAEVGKTKITKEDFLEVASPNAAQYPGPPDSAKAMLLKDLVRRELLLQGAIASGLPDSTFRPFLEQMETQLTREKLFTDLTGGPAEVSDAEVAEFYERRKTEGHAQIIFTTVERMARAAHDELKRGADFTSVANRFNMAGVLPPGGDLGFVPPGSMVPPLDDYLVTAPLDSVVGPFEVPTQGWFLMKVVERRAAEQPAFDMVKSSLAEQLKQRKQRTMLMRAVDQLGKNYEVKLESGAGNRVVEKLGGSPLVAGMGGQSPPPTLTDQDRAITLGNFRGGTYTVGDAEVDLRSSPNPPPFTLLPMVERWVHNQLLERAAREEAKKRKLAEDPEIKKTLKSRLESLRLERYYGAAVASRAQATEEDIRALYQSRADAFVKLDEVKLLTATLPDSAAAATLIQHAGHSGTLREASAMASPQTRVRAETIKYPNNDQQWAGLQPTFIGMAEKAYGGPLRVAGGWMVYQVQSKVQATQPFESLPPQVAEFLGNEAVEQKREARLSELADSLEKAITVKTYPKNLAGIPWPPPPPAPEKARAAGR